MQATNWREERRRDRMADAQIGRENETARAQARIAESAELARLKRDERQARRNERRAARKQRAARRAELTAWLRDHVTGLLFVPVIVVPGVLAWTAMAAYGRQVFGPAGVLLPAFSEGAMWAFAAMVTITAHRAPDRPLWPWRLGMILAAAAGAAMNFIHGITPDPGQLRGVGAGLVMALISVAGLTVHQLITAGPRQSRSERTEARIASAVRRRERAIQRAALRNAVAALDADGTAHLAHRPGTVELRRRWYGGVHFASVAYAPQRQDSPAPEVHSWPRPAPVLAVGVGAPQSPAESAPAPVPEVHPEERCASAPGVHPAAAPESAPKRTSKRTPKVVSDATAERRFAADLAAGRVPSERQIKRELHVGQERAKAIREHLAQRRVVVPMRQAR